MRNILLMTGELATATAVSSALESNGKLAAEHICSDLSDLTAHLEQITCPAALVDIDGEPRSILAGLEPLARRFTETKFVVLSGAIHQELLLGAMHAGARHFLLKEAVRVDLNRILSQLCPENGHGSIGSAVTILSAGGGCGATTVAVNLAAELQMRSAADDADPADASTLVVDLDSHYGSVAAYLGLEGSYGLFDLLGRTGAIDAQLIQSTSLSHAEGISALISASCDRLGEQPPVDPQRLGQAIDACKTAHRWTVVDAPRITAAAAAELARRSVATLLLLQLNVKDIRIARRMLTALHEQGIDRESVRVLATRYHKRRMLIEPVAARKALGLADDQPLGILANDYYGVTNAVNLGKPMAHAALRSDFRRDLQKLAATIASLSPVRSRPMQAVRA